MDNPRVIGVSQSSPSRQTEDFHKRVAEEIVKMLHKELEAAAPNDADDIDFLDHLKNEADDSQLLAVEPPLTLSKIFSKLTPLERLWLAGMVKQHGTQMVLTQWPMYEIQINYIRCLRQIQKALAHALLSCKNAGWIHHRIYSLLEKKLACP